MTAARLVPPSAHVRVTFSARLPPGFMNQFHRVPALVRAFDGGERMGAPSEVVGFRATDRLKVLLAARACRPPSIMKMTV